MYDFEFVNNKLKKTTVSWYLGEKYNYVNTNSFCWGASKVILKLNDF